MDISETQHRKSNSKRFLSPHPLRECVKRLQHLSTSSNLFFSDRVEVVRSTDQVYDYEIRHWEFLNLIATMRGSLIYREANLTGVTYRVEYNPFFFIVLFLYYAVIVLMLIGAIINRQVQYVIFGAIGMLWSLLLIAWMDILVRRFVKSVKHILS